MQLNRRYQLVYSQPPKVVAMCCRSSKEAVTMEAIKTSSPTALATLLRGLVPPAELQPLIAFIAEYASSDLIDEAELDELIGRFVEADHA